DSYSAIATRAFLWICAALLGVCFHATPVGAADDRVAALNALQLEKLAKQINNAFEQHVVEKSTQRKIAEKNGAGRDRRHDSQKQSDAKKPGAATGTDELEASRRHKNEQLEAIRKFIGIIERMEQSAAAEAAKSSKGDIHKALERIRQL